MGSQLVTKKPHVLAVPFPAQGHVTPFMKLARRIARSGIMVTFVNTHSIHAKILASMQDHSTLNNDNHLVLTSIPDGQLPEDDEENDIGPLERLRISIPRSVSDLISQINASSSVPNVTCVIADITVGSLLEVATTFGAELVIFSPPSAASFASICHASELLEDGRIDANGILRTGEVIALGGDILTWKKNELPWSAPFDLNIQRIFFDYALRAGKAGREAKWLLCNTCYEIESTACDLSTNLLPIGPLLELDSSRRMSSFHCEDETCLAWLESKPLGSVIFVSFGSSAMLSQQQLDELALGLELSNRAFLWVARLDLANGVPAVYPDGFLERTKLFGKIVTWAPQEKVLSHRAIHCFMSHCGWNSTLEGVSKGIPFLCWPYFTDQTHNQSYLCDKWEIGLRIEANEIGIRTRDEIVAKIGKMFSDHKFKENATKLKELCEKSTSEGGSSYNNFETFINFLKK